MNHPLFHRFQPRPLLDPFASGVTEKAIGSSTDYGTTFDPEAYRLLSPYVQALGWNSLLDGATFLRDGCILDLGSGHGGNLASLASDLRQINCRVFGLDKAAEMVLNATAKYPAEENPNLVFLEGPAERAGTIIAEYCKKHDEAVPTFTSVLSNYTLHWVRDPHDPQRFLHQEVFASLNPLQKIGGEQRHFCAHTDAFKELFDAGYEVIREDPRWQRYFEVRPGDHSVNGEWRHPPLVTEQGLLSALDAAGYAGTATVHTDERRFPNVDLLKAWVGAMIRPFMSRIPEAEKNDFVDSWIGKYVAHNPTALRPDGSTILTDRNILVVAHKKFHKKFEVSA